MKIDLTVKHNFTAIDAPGSSDDVASGYEPGSRWIDVLTGTEYVCRTAKRGDATWQVNPYSGIDSIAGLRAALGNVIASPTRVAYIERFEKRPYLAADVTIFTDSTGGVTTTPNTLAEITSGGTAADEGPVENALAKIALKINNMLLANPNFEVAGTNMTSALATHQSTAAGLQLATAGANNDQAILQPRQTNSGDSRWASVPTDLLPEWSTSFRLASVANISIKAGLALTNAHNLTTDDDQIALWFSTATGGNFLLAYSAAGTDATIDTGVTPAAATEYRLRIKTLTTLGAYDVYLNETVVARLRTGETGLVFKPYMSIQALTGAAKTIQIRHQALTMQNA